MNRNKTDEIKDIAQFITILKSKDDVENFMLEILTTAELTTLSKRWRIINLLKQGLTQREIANSLKVSLCKVTRGSKILKNKKSVINKYLKEK